MLYSLNIDIDNIMSSYNYNTLNGTPTNYNSPSYSSDFAKHTVYQHKTTISNNGSNGGVSSGACAISIIAILFMLSIPACMLIALFGIIGFFLIAIIIGRLKNFESYMSTIQSLTNSFDFNYSEVATTTIIIIGLIAMVFVAIACFIIFYYNRRGRFTNRVG